MPTWRQRVALTLAITVAVTCWAVTCWAVACLAAPSVASADSQLITNCPHITATGGVILADTATECATQDNYQYNAAPTEPDFIYPWDDPFYGPALLIAGMRRGPVPAAGGGVR